MGWTTTYTNKQKTTEHTRFIFWNAWSTSYPNSNKSSVLWEQCWITHICWCLDSCKGSRSVPAKSAKSVPKLELEAAVIGVRLHSTILIESSFSIEKTLFRTDSQVVLDWIASTKKQPAYIANRFREIAASTQAKQWRHISKLNNPADQGTCGLDPREISLKWLQPPEFLSSAEQISNQPVPSKPAVVATTAHTASNVPEPIIDTARFSSWTKMLLTLATVYNLMFTAKKFRYSKQQYTTDDIDLSRKHLIRSSQENSFHTTISSLKRGLKHHSKCKLRSLNPMLDQNGILRLCGRLQFAPDALEIKMCPIILHAKDTVTHLFLEHAHRICIHQGTEPQNLQSSCCYKLDLEIQPALWPPFGGLWERLIQTAKRTLLIILGSKRLSLDVLQTKLVESETNLNSRPLTNVAALPDNEMPLTPNHFLISRPLKSLPPGKFDSQIPASIRTWRNLQQMMNHFWKRLVKEYLPTLHKRSKWNEHNQSPHKVNDVVWILKDMTPRRIWPLGRVLEGYPGRDGQHRVVKVKMAYGTFVHPISALARILAD